MCRSQWPSNVTAINDHIYFSFSISFLLLRLLFDGGTIQSSGALRDDLQSRSFLKLFLSPLSSLETLSIARNILIMMTKNRRMCFSQRANQQQQFLTNIYMHVLRWERQTLNLVSQLYNFNWRQSHISINFRRHTLASVSMYFALRNFCIFTLIFYLFYCCWYVLHFSIQSDFIGICM